MERRARWLTAIPASAHTGRLIPRDPLRRGVHLAGGMLEATSGDDPIIKRGA